MAKPNPIDLREVDPRGRLDVVAFRGAEALTRMIEEKVGLGGIWDSIHPHVHELVVNNVTGLELPTEASILLKIMQANMGKRIEKEGM